jgi:uncharacterized membrane protein (DUF4010 family)
VRNMAITSGAVIAVELWEKGRVHTVTKTMSYFIDTLYSLRQLVDLPIFIVHFVDKSRT